MLKVALGIVFILTLSLLGVMACSEEAPPPTATTATEARSQPAPTATNPPPTEPPAPTRVPTPEPTPTNPPTLTPTSAPTATPVPTPTATPTPTLTPTATPTPTATSTPVPTATSVPTPTTVPTATPIPPTPTPTRPPKQAPDSKPETSFENTPAARLLKATYSRVYERLEELPWTQDSITGAEQDVHRMALLARQPELASRRRSPGPALAPRRHHGNGGRCHRVVVLAGRGGPGGGWRGHCQTLPGNFGG